jgi:hypothetical protein
MQGMKRNTSVLTKYGETLALFVFGKPLLNSYRRYDSQSYIFRLLNNAKQQRTADSLNRNNGKRELYFSKNLALGLYPSSNVFFILKRFGNWLCFRPQVKKGG